MTKARYLYNELAGAVQARLNCIQSGNAEWKDKHGDAEMEGYRAAEWTAEEARILRRDVKRAEVQP